MRKARAWLTAVASVLLASCASQYFRAAPLPAEPPAPRSLAQRPDTELWWGIVFNGEKIGFSHLAIAPADEPDLWEIRSDAAFVLRFLGFTKRVNLKARDVVRSDLSLVRFNYEYVIDGNAISLAGERHGGALAVSVAHADETVQRTLEAPGAVYPQSGIALYPALHGLATGREFRYDVWSGELQKITGVVQKVGRYERSPLFEGDAYRVDTRMEGYGVEGWIDASGRTLLEIGMNGVLISGLETRERALGYLASASLNKAEALVDFSLVRVSPPIADARRSTRMRVALEGGGSAVPSDGVQRCEREGARFVCEVMPAGSPGDAAGNNDPRHLASTFTVPATNATITSLAGQIAGDAGNERERMARLLAWIQANIRKSPADAWSALDVLRTREAECQGHAYLFAALARSLRIPTRVVNGLVYSDDHGGFLYHTWVESFVDGRWIAIDPTFGAMPADATHVKLVEGETFADLTPLADWIGRLRMQVIEIR
ncbi:MAG: transglutaminase domain-containing protein [Burkholderiales bacterium]